MSVQIEPGIAKRGERFQVDVYVAGRRVRKAVKSNTLAEARALRDALKSKTAKPYRYVCNNCGEVFFSGYQKQLRSNFCSNDCLSASRAVASEMRNGLPKWAVKLLKTTRKRAALKRMEFSLTNADMASIIYRADGACEVTGVQFDVSDTADGGRRPWFPSIDRIDSRIGYTHDNTRLVCVAANLAMNTWGELVLHEIAQSMVKCKIL